MFESVLIANRGEIACRVARTARRMGIRTIAVFSDADAEALHVELADEAYRLGPASAAESYLNIERLLAIAERARAEAVHPGYGFLAENARLAEACAAAGLTFVGPPPAAIRAMGSKSTALELMSRAGVPVLPGYRGDDQSDAALRNAAGNIGFPLMVKPTAGGGGKGMRVVDSAGDLAPAIAAARREAHSAFGDDTLLLERYLGRARHVEVQVFADRHGRTVHLYERDCSIQRRHQKIMEEAPAPGLDDPLRERMGAVAIRAAEAIGYEGAGTVEFLLDVDAAARNGQSRDPFYFMEMNTRLQVEHPVTEMVLGVDLVEWQLRVACGERLPDELCALKPSGHAVEARIYAEDPGRDFLPASGRLTHLSPPSGPGVRVDTGVRRGDSIGVHYDPMIAKLIVHGTDREAALRRLRRALAQYEVLGVRTNISYLSRIAGHPAYAAGDFDTGFIPRHEKALLGAPAPASEAADAVLAAALFVTLTRSPDRTADEPWSPWSTLHGFRLNAAPVEHVRLRSGEKNHPFAVRRLGGTFEVTGDDRVHRASARLDEDGRLIAQIDGRRLRAAVVREGDRIHLWLDGCAWEFAVVDASARRPRAYAGQQHLTAPMPGKIVAVLVETGAAVARGQPLVTMEAMKMEHTIAAPFDGVVESVRFGVGDLVTEGADLIHLATAK